MGIAWLVLAACGGSPSPGEADSAPWNPGITGADPGGDDDTIGEESDASTSGATSAGATSSEPPTDDEGSTGAGTGGDDTTSDTTGGGAVLDPPANASSGGAGGGAAGGEVRMTPDGITYRIIAPGDAGPVPLMVVFSGTEGGANMTNNLLTLGPVTGTEGFVFAVLDGVQYNGNGAAGASVLDAVRADYDVDNDRTYLLSESAGTTAGLELGLALRQSYFAAYWANDVNASLEPSFDAASLGFAPYGNAGPGGQFASADAIVAGMAAAGYRTPAPAPYDGPGSETHGAVDQFVAALQWFPGKRRQ